MRLTLICNAADRAEVQTHAVAVLGAERGAEFCHEPLWRSGRDPSADPPDAFLTSVTLDLASHQGLKGLIQAGLGPRMRLIHETPSGRRPALSGWRRRDLAP